jgi:hypothetical protein
MSHGYSAVKEMHLDCFAEVFTEAGIGAIVLDNCNFARATARCGRSGSPGRLPRHCPSLQFGRLACRLCARRTP